MGICGGKKEDVLEPARRPTAENVDSGHALAEFQRLSEALDTGWLPAGAERVMEAFAKSKDIISMAVGVLIPPPGGSVASAVVEVAYWAVQAVFNTQNCCVLARKCCDVLFAVLSNREVLGKKDTLRRAMEQLQAVANDILAFVKQFASKGWLKKLVQWQGDIEAFEALSGKLKESMEFMNFTAGIEAATASFAMNEKDVELQRTLEGLGGVEAVTQDPAKLKMLTSKMKAGDATITTLLMQEMQSLAADRQEGPHRLINNVQLQLLWRAFFKGKEAIGWEFWWEVFPAELEASVRERLSGLLSGSGPKVAFQSALHVSNPDMVNVIELRRAFSSDDDLADKVKALLAASKAAGPGMMQRIVSLKLTGGGAGAGPNWLPAVCDNFLGRDADRSSVTGELSKKKRLVVIVGGPGQGKSELAYDVGHWLYTSSKASGGAYAIDLRGVTTADMVVSRCNAGLCPNEVGSDDLLRSTLLKLAERTAPVVVVMDALEDAYGNKDSYSKLQAALSQMFQLVPQLSVVATSRQRLPLADVKVGKGYHALEALSTSAAADLLMSLADCGSKKIAKQVAEKCGGVPLLLNLYGSCLACGSLTTEELLSGAAGLGAVGSMEADMIQDSVMRSLEAVPEKYRPAALKLSVFPNHITHDGAAFVLGLEDFAAKSLFKFLNEQCLLQKFNDPAAGCEAYKLQLVVRDVCREILANGSGDSYGVSSQDWQACQLRYIEHACSLAEEIERLHYSSPLSAYYQAGTAKQTLEAALVLLVGHSSLHKACASMVAQLLMRLQHLKAPLDRATVRNACERMTNVCKASGDTLSAAIYQLHVSLTGESNGDAFKASIAQAKAARDLLGGAAGSADGALVAASAWRQEGVLHRDLGNLDDSCAALNAAVGALKGPLAALKADDSSLQAQRLRMENIVILAELSGTLDYMGKTDEGLTTGRDAVDAAEAALGSEHPVLALALNNYAFFLKAKGQHEEAVKLHDRAADIRTKVLGSHHPDTATSYNQKALSLQELKRMREAREALGLALDIRIKNLGEEDLLVANTWFNLGAFHKADGNRKEAIAAFQKARDIRLAKLGAGNKKTQAAEQELGMLLALKSSRSLRAG